MLVSALTLDLLARAHRLDLELDAQRQRLLRAARGAPGDGEPCAGGAGPYREAGCCGGGCCAAGEGDDARPPRGRRGPRFAAA